jgi:hypothetical protein
MSFLIEILPDTAEAFGNCVIPFSRVEILTARPRIL